MSDVRFRKIIVAAARAAAGHKRMGGWVADAFIARYGATYSDADADWLIDVLDYGLGKIPTVEECDRIMAEAGYPAAEKPDD